jgi:hypothetical protein
MNAAMSSIVTVLVPADSFDLTTLDDVKLELGITGTGEDAKLQRWITQASYIVANYCKRVFARETISETFRWGAWAGCADTLALSRFPVESITSVTVDGTLLDPAAYEISPTDGLLYLLDSLGRRSLWSFSISIVVVYIGGRTLPSTVLQDVEHATIAIISDMRADAGRDSDVVEEEIPGVMRKRWWSSGDAKTTLPLDIAGLLDPHINYRNS